MIERDVFRKVSLERLSSPEQLDQLMQVTRPKAWVALSALGGLVLTSVVWGVKGSIPTKVTGQGILIKSGGILQVIAPASGRVTDVSVGIGDVVSEGQVVARIAQPEVTEKIQQAKTSLANMRHELEHVAVFGGRQVELQLASLVEQRHNLEQSIATQENDVKWLEEKLANQQQLVDQGLLTKQTLITTRQQYESAKVKIRSDRNELSQIEIKRLQLLTQKDKDVKGSQVNVEQAQTQLEQLERELKASTDVVSGYTGRILEITTEQGSVVARGEPLLSLDLTGKSVKELEAVIYVPSNDGKKVKPGMQIQIAPSTVMPEEYGLMLGKVTYVSDYPATAKGMQLMLKSKELVGTLSGGNAPYEVRVDLLPDLATESGYKWSSSKGPPLKIRSGTMCAGDIVVDTARPIEMVLPLLRKYTGI